MGRAGGVGGACLNMYTYQSFHSSQRIHDHTIFLKMLPLSTKCMSYKSIVVPSIFMLSAHLIIRHSVGFFAPMTVNFFRGVMDLPKEVQRISHLSKPDFWMETSSSSVPSFFSGLLS